jgi:asparagine synthase (glutamine-hydrolysing)
MSVIYGVIHTQEKPHQKPQAEILRKNLDSVCFDRENVWRDEKAHLGVLLRQLLRNDADQAPLFDPDSALTVCADARLDNREELATQFEISPEILPTVPDSLLILKAYQKWGEDSPKQLLGDFAYAIYDKNRQRLFCARDHLGIRSFFYYWIDGVFAFCTLRRPLMAACPVTPTPNDAFIISAFICAHAELSQTVANEINRLPPAHSLTLDAGGLKVQRYWQPEKRPLLQLAGEAEYAGALREVFSKAVACRTVTDYPVVTHLSSGLDSASITVLATRELRKRGKKPLVLSWSPEPAESTEKFGDERDLIRDVCRQEEIECRFSKPKQEQAGQFFEKDFSTWGNNHLYPDLEHLSWIKQQDCRAVLSGWGGDEFTSFSGQQVYLADVLLQRGFLSLLSEACKMRMNRTGSLRGMAKEVLYPLIPDAVYDRFVNLPFYSDRDSLINPAFAKELKAARKKRDRWHQRDVKAFQRQRLMSGLLPHNFEYLVELSELHGFNYLFPVYDKRVIEFILSVPTEQLCRHGWRRFLFRNAMEGILPPTIQWNRSKHEAAISKGHQSFNALLQKKALDYFPEINKHPLFLRYFAPESVKKIIISMKMNHFINLYSYVKFLERSFPL